MEKLKRHRSVLSRFNWLKVLVLVPMIGLAYGPMHAQRHYEPHVHIGGHGGVTLSNVSFYPHIKEQLLMGTQFGLSFRYAEERHVGFLVEVNFDQRGWKENFEEYNNQFNYYHRTNYIELPVMTHIFFGSRKVKGFINLGPQIGYMLSDNIESNFDYKNPSKVTGFPSENRYTEQMGLDITKRFDYGITAGAGIEFVIKKRHSVMLEARYYYGLGNIFPSAKKDFFSASRGSSIAVSIGYMFRLK